MRLSEVLEGQTFTTRITKRVGLVKSHSDQGVEVEWQDTGVIVYLHPEVLVAE